MAQVTGLDRAREELPVHLSTAVYGDLSAAALAWATAKANDSATALVDGHSVDTNTLGEAVVRDLASNLPLYADRLLGVDFEQLEAAGETNLLAHLEPWAASVTIFTEAYIRYVKETYPPFLQELVDGETTVEALLRKPYTFLPETFPWLESATRALAVARKHVPDDVRIASPLEIGALPSNWREENARLAIGGPRQGIDAPVVPSTHELEPDSPDRAARLADIKANLDELIATPRFEPGNPQDRLIADVVFLTEEKQRLTTALRQSSSGVSPEDAPAILAGGTLDTGEQLRRARGRRDRIRKYEAVEIGSMRHAARIALGTGAAGASAFLNHNIPIDSETLASAGRAVASTAIGANAWNFVATFVPFKARNRVFEFVKRPLLKAANRQVTAAREQLEAAKSAVEQSLDDVNSLVSRAEHVFGRQCVTDDRWLGKDELPRDAARRAVARRHHFGPAIDPVDKGWATYAARVTNAEVSRREQGLPDHLLPQDDTPRLEPPAAERTSSVRHAADKVRGLVDRVTHSL